MNMFDRCHIPPSHRRMAHQSWASSMHLLFDLTIGYGRTRYLCSREPCRQAVQVEVRGFSASVAYVCLLWQMQGVDVTSTRGGNALPPALLPLILHQRGRQLMLFHVTSDTLCQWDPSKAIVNNVGCRYIASFATRFKSCVGTLEMQSTRVDIAPLRLVSWLSCEVPAVKV